MSKEIQNKEITLPGGIGTIIVNGKECEIVKSVSDYREGRLTLTINPTESVPKKSRRIYLTDIETIEPKQLTGE